MCNHFWVVICLGIIAVPEIKVSFSLPLRTPPQSAFSLVVLSFLGRDLSGQHCHPRDKTKKPDFLSLYSILTPLQSAFLFLPLVGGWRLHPPAIAVPDSWFCSMEIRLVLTIQGSCIILLHIVKIPSSS